MCRRLGTCSQIACKILQNALLRCESAYVFFQQFLLRSFWFRYVHVYVCIHDCVCLYEIGAAWLCVRVCWCNVVMCLRPSCVLFPVHVVETRAMATAVVVVVAVRGGKVDVDVNVNFAALVLCVVCSLLYFCWKSTVVSKGEEGELSLM